uniref:Uncharacterized protein n=1 Tax=Anguilla anguilla TaxID=7936 RepID=A0A0E9X9F6_ANGAN
MMGARISSAEVGISRTHPQTTGRVSLPPGYSSPALSTTHEVASLTLRPLQKLCPSVTSKQMVNVYIKLLCRSAEFDRGQGEFNSGQYYNTLSQVFNLFSC